MSYEFYKILHIAGLLLTVFGLFGLSSVLWNESTPKPHLRKIWMISHGVGLLLLLVAGFGLAARLGVTGSLPGWIYGKLAIWLLVGGILSLVKRKPQNSGIWITLIMVLVITAVILAVTKPF